VIPRVRARTGAEMPVLGLGTWRMGEDTRRRAAEVAALKLGFDLGMTLVDTAEMYAEGGAERVVSEAIGGRRDEVFVVSKVLPENASLSGTIQAAERSLRRLATDRIDLYLLHWAGPHPLEGTLAAFRRLQRDGKILHYGVSNFGLPEVEQALGHPGGDLVGANQVLYNLERRGIERSLLPWSRRRGIVVMAYSPLEQGRLKTRPALEKVARAHDLTPACAALAWTIRESGIVALVKASDPRHVRDNVRAAAVRFSAADLDELERAYPAPEHDVPLETL